jgi:predicted nucleic acid-binding Zn ribbon protein
MPIYTYQVIHDDGTEGAIFEMVHSMSEATLTQHPETGEKVVRVYQPTHIAGSGNERIQKQNTSDKNLDRLGFTKYVRNGKGNYEKHVGAGGPDRLSVD